MFKRIVVPVDFSASSLKALDHAARLARPARAELVVVHAVEPPYFALGPEFYSPGYDLGALLQEIQSAARERLARLVVEQQKKRLRVRTELRIGSAAEVIVETAKKVRADLIVIATHGRTGLAHVLLGSVAERVIRHAPCAVLCVRGRASGGGRAAAKKARPPSGAAARRRGRRA